MSQHDMNIANQGFPAFRSDLNNALSALATLSSGATEPSTTFANQLWYDSTNDLLKIRNEADDAWITLAYINQTSDEAEFRTAVLQAIDSAGLAFKTDDGTSRMTISDAGAVDVVGTITASRGIGDTLTDTTNSGDITLDFSTYQNFVLTLTGDITLKNPSTESVGQSGFIVFIQDSTGARGVTLEGDYETPAGATLALSSAASTTDVVPYIVIASNRVLLGTPQLAFS